MEINEDVIITGNLTVVGNVQCQNLKSNQDVVCGRNYLFDAQEGVLIDNDSNARFTGVSAASLVLTGNAPTIANATDLASAISSLNALLSLLRTSQTVQ